MSTTPLLPPVQPYKANLHGHTTISDGRLSPAGFKQAYRQQGYAVAAITDHNQYRWHKELCDSGFVCLAAAEYNINTREDGPDRLSNRRGTYHFNVYDTSPHTRPAGYAPPAPPNAYSDIRAINDWVQALAAEGFLCCYNHPYWSRQDYRHYAGLRHLFGMEIYNHGCELDGLYGYAPQAFDDMLAQGQNVYPLATDDNHNAYPMGHPLCDSFGGFVMLYPQQLDYAGVIDALQYGDFYATMGPLFRSLYVEDGALVVECDPVEKIYVKSAGRHCLCSVATPGETITGARFSLEGFDMPFRVDLRDAHGLHANTRAYTL